MPPAVVMHRFGLASLRPEDRAPEPLGHGAVRVAIKAVSLNYRDVLVVRGVYASDQPLPLIPCSDGAGVVLEVGPGVTGFAPGDRVCTHMVPDWQEGAFEPRMRLTTLGGPAQGVLSEERVLPYAAVVPIPRAVSFEAAACLPVAGVAAWCALTNEASIGPGSRVLVMGTGGLGTLALQIAKALGAQVAVISSSDEKLTRVGQLGADFTQNSRRARWGEAVRRWSGGGVDVVLHTGGVAAFDESAAATRDGGVIAMLGVLGEGGHSVNFADVVMRRIRVQGIFVGSRVDLERYLRFIELRGIEPVIDRIFDGLSSARRAFAYFTAGHHLGKVVIRAAQ